VYGNAESKDLVHTSRSAVTKNAFEFLKTRPEAKVGAAFDGREMSQFLVKRLQVAEPIIRPNQTAGVSFLF
jgi:hypothetical protein